MAVIDTLRRDAGDDFNITVSFAESDVFDVTPITTCTCTVAPLASLTLGTPAVGSGDNIITLRVYGGSNSAYSEITFAVENNAATPAKLNRKLGVSTEDL